MNDAKSLDSVQAYVKLKSLADSINMATSDKNDLLLFMAVSAFRASRPWSQRALMDAREIHSFRDLSKVAASFRAPDLDKSVVRSNYQSSGNCLGFTQTNANILANSLFMQLNYYF